MRPGRHPNRIPGTPPTDFSARFRGIGGTRHAETLIFYHHKLVQVVTRQFSNHVFLIQWLKFPPAQPVLGFRQTHIMGTQTHDVGKITKCSSGHSQAG